MTALKRSSVFPCFSSVVSLHASSLSALGHVEGEPRTGELARPLLLPRYLVGLGELLPDYLHFGGELGVHILHLRRVLRGEQAPPSLHQVFHRHVAVRMTLDLYLLLPSVDCEGSLGQCRRALALDL